MKHARPDYDRFQDPTDKIPADEPVMLFRGQDKYAADTLDYYARLVDHNNPEMASVVRNHAALMRAWPTHKEPDL